MDAKSPNDEFKTPKLAILEETGYEPCPATVSRWHTRGVAGIDGERILLPVWFLGRKPFTTRRAVRQWLDEVTAARMSRIKQSQTTAKSVSDAELRSAGLLDQKNGGAK